MFQGGIRRTTFLVPKRNYISFLQKKEKKKKKRTFLPSARWEVGGGTQKNLGPNVRLEISTTTGLQNHRRTKFATHIKTKRSVLPSDNKLLVQIELFIFFFFFCNRSFK